MLIKIIGMLLITSSATLLGIYYSFHSTYRINDLSEMKKAFTVLKSEIQFNSSELSEAFINVSERISEPVSKIFTDMSKKLAEKSGQPVFSLWGQALEGKKQDTYFSPEDIDMLLSFGKTLGYLDKKMQIDSIDLTINSIEEKIKFISLNKNKTKKMYQSIGVLGGLLITIILI